MTTNEVFNVDSESFREIHHSKHKISKNLSMEYVHLFEEKYSPFNALYRRKNDHICMTPYRIWEFFPIVYVSVPSDII